MSGVRKWTLFLRAVLVAVGALLLGVGAFRAEVIRDPRVAFWPTLDLMHVDGLQAHGPLYDLASLAAVQLVVWTLFSYLLFLGFDGLRHSMSRRP